MGTVDSQKDLTETEAEQAPQTWGKTPKPPIEEETLANITTILNLATKKPKDLTPGERDIMENVAFGNVRVQKRGGETDVIYG